MRDGDPILLTGGTGFVGSHLASYFLLRNQPVHCLVKPDTNLGHVDWLKGAVRTHIYDGTAKSLIRIVQQVRPRSVFHLAAMTVASHSPDQIEPLIQSNILLGTQLLEAMAISGVKWFINAGTFWQHYNSEGYSPTCLYAATKQAFEDILQYYTEARSIGAITLKLFDTYGPCDPREKLFSLLRRAAITGVPLEMSPGDQELDLVYVDDVVEAFAQAELNLSSTPLPKHQVFGVSSGYRIVLRDLVTLYSQIIAKTVPVKWGARSYREREVMTPWAPLQCLPGWKVKTGLAEGIKLMEDSTRCSELRT